jgi:hypothetical protein
VKNDGDLVISFNTRFKNLLRLSKETFWVIHVCFFSCWHWQDSRRKAQCGLELRQPYIEWWPGQVVHGIKRLAYVFSSARMTLRYTIHLEFWKSVSKYRLFLVSSFSQKAFYYTYV